MSDQLFKDSGQDWLGSIPNHWNLHKLGAHFRERKVTVNDTDFPALSVTMQGIVPQLETAAKSDASDKRKQVLKGDFVINSRSDRKGSSGISPLDGSVSQISIVLEPKGISPFYANYLLRSYAFQEEFYKWGSGIVADLWSTRFSAMKQILIPVPPRAEQDAIVEFLDRELEQIDALIAKNEELVTNLLERRRALIASLVGFGSASSKAVPRNWIPQRLRHLATIESGRDYKEVEVFEGGYPIYGSGGEFGRASRYLYSGESVLLGRKGTIDRPLYVNEPFWTVDTMYWTRFKPGVCIKFMYYWATTIPFKMYSTNTALPSMTGADLKNMPINLPPLDEQIRIATDLDEAIQGMDILQENSEKCVLLLKERRQALISSAVTGKLELQGAS